MEAVAGHGRHQRRLAPARRTAAAVALALLAGAASAVEWVLFSDEKDLVYVDAQTIGDGPITQRRAWVLRLLQTPRVNSSGAAYSQRVLYVFDCPGARMAVRTIYSYASKDGAGPPLWTVQIRQHELVYGDVPPGTFAEPLMRIACS